MKRTSWVLVMSCAALGPRPSLAQARVTASARPFDVHEASITDLQDAMTSGRMTSVALVADGLSNRQVARELQLSEHTVKKYLFRIFDKLGVSSRVELVLYAVSHGRAEPVEWIPAG